MTPVRLCLSNFMSYPDGAPVIDFTSFRIACLTGDNGNGKSALLDAITWALWGQARAPVDSLVRLGQQTMFVDFEFDVDDVSYRVLRKRTRTGAGSTHTDLQVAAADGTYRSQTEQGERETQKKINGLLRMDYRTFISSAFILQGRSDEFTRSSATDRKQILAEILDLERYELLETRAKGRHDHSKDLALRLQMDIESLAQEIARKPQYQESLQSAQAGLVEKEKALQLLEGELGQLRTKMSRIEAESALLENLQAQEQQARLEALDGRRRSETFRLKLTQLDAKLLQRPAIEKRLAEWTDAKRRLEAMEEARNRYADADTEATKIETHLTALRHQIELRISKLDAQFRALERQAAGAGRLESEITKARHSNRPVADLEKQWDELREENELILAAIHKAQGGAKAVEDKLEGLRKRGEFLEAPAAACPLCLHPLQPHDHSRIRKDLEEEKRLLQAQGETFRKDGEKAERDRQELRRRGNETKASLDSARQMDQQITRLETELRTAQEAVTAAKDLEKSLLFARQELESPLDPAKESRLIELQAIKASAGYDRKAHEALKERVRSLAAAERESQELDHAARNRDEVYQNLEETQTRAQAQESRRAALAAQLAPLAGVPIRKAELSRQIQDITMQKDRIGREAAASQESVGRWATLLDQCAEKENQERARRDEMTAASKDAAIYKELSAAFSKRGIQAMIIENIIPELEDEANRLLGRMTDHGMHIQFRTQRELKKGGGAETLDIVIGDELGDRPYECYSGGEAFRINFAIRIALSRLLARRAGARLQTIVIDEGFGSQDAQGRKRLVEAIESVKEEFTRILVITHLDDLKDEFPVRLHVSKDENGSRVTLLS